MGDVDRILRVVEDDNIPYSVDESRLRLRYLNHLIRLVIWWC